MKQIFINLPVKNIDASMAFYSQLGFTLNPLFTFDNQKCMMWSNEIYVMLQTYEMFKSGNKKNLADPKNDTVVTFTLPVENPARLDEIIGKALKAGGTETTQIRNEDFMLVRNIEDLDGHQWAIMFLDTNKFKKLRKNKEA